MKLANEYRCEANTMTSYLSQIILVIFAGLSLCCGTTQYSGETIVDTVLPTPVERKAEPVKGEQTAVFAGVCFWGIEGVFEHVNGVIDARSGYSGGTKATANYD